jgi:Ca2+:H+ antiporter
MQPLAAQQGVVSFRSAEERNGSVRLTWLWYLLLPAVPVAFLLRWLNAGPVVTFLSAGLGIVPLAALMGRSTDALAVRIGPQFGGLLNATFGNAAELILGLVGIKRGLFAIVKASLTGSIIGNALLVLGAGLLVGGLRHRKQLFDRERVGLQATLLVLAAIGLTIPTVLSYLSGPGTQVHLSVEVAGVLLCTYLLSVCYSLLREHDRDVVMGKEPESGEGPRWGVARALSLLAFSTILVTVLSEFLAGSIEQARDQGSLEALGMSEVFVGVVLVAIIGNAAEHSTAVQMAYHNKIDLALHIAIGSSLQIALLVTPLLVFGSLALAPQPLDLHFTLLEVLAVWASVIVTHLVAADGQSHWMEGVLLLAVYIILALAFYHLPPVSSSQAG